MDRKKYSVTDSTTNNQVLCRIIEGLQTSDISEISELQVLLQV
jgi:hypothetical protein